MFPRHAVLSAGSALGLALALACAGGCATAPAPSGGVYARPAASAALATLPALELTTLDGQPMSLHAALGGRVAVIALWATWCKTCRGELDDLTRLAARAGVEGATVIGVAVGEPRDTVAAFVARRGLPYPQLVDEHFRLPEAIGQDRLPTTLVLDREARIVHVGGALDENALQALRSELTRSRTATRAPAAQPARPRLGKAR